MAHSSLPSIRDRQDAERAEAVNCLQHAPDEHAASKRQKRFSTDSPSPLRHSNSNDGWLDTFRGDLLNRLPNDAPLHKEQGIKMESQQAKANVAPLFKIPAELVHAVLSYLAPFDLLNVIATCRTLRAYASAELHWHRCVQHNLPGTRLSSSSPCQTYRELFAALDRLWFIPRYKIWFCDRDLMGKLIVARYDEKRGCIEAYQLLAVSRKDYNSHWPVVKDVVIHGFAPQVSLHLDKPILQFKVEAGQAEREFSSRPGANRFADEMPMKLDDRLAGMYSNFMLTRPLDPDKAGESLSVGYPYDHVWPPPAIPARDHVSGIESGQAVVQIASQDRPRRRCEVSDQTFRIRQWMELTGTPPLSALWAAPLHDGQREAATPIGVHIGEEIVTYSTLDPRLYTPTATKPWRGIWVGDYDNHGCEFLLMNQPDDAPVTDEKLGLLRGASESDEAWEKRRLDARIYRGRLEAIKLTGDPNVPRGEYSFVAEDLGPKGYVGEAKEEPFAGARIVRSRGHVAAAGFRRDRYIETELVLLSHDRLAQCWDGVGHVSFFERVRIDDLIKM